MSSTSDSTSGVRKTRWLQISVLAIAAVLVQLALHYTYLPWQCGDSEGYSSQASILYGSSFTRDPGERTPGYPLFLLGCEMVSPYRVAYWLRPESAEFITWTQSALSVVSVVLLYLSMERLRIRPAIAFALALVFALLVGVGQFAMLVLAENLCVVAMVLSGYLVTVTVDRWQRGQPVQPYATLAGFAFGAAILVRPNMMPFWLTVALAIPALAVWRRFRREPGDFQGALLHIARPLLAGGTLPLLVWLFVHYENTGVVTMSGIAGLARTSAAYNLFDQVQPQDKVLGEIMEKYYRQTNSDGHMDRSYAWLALDEIETRHEEMPRMIRGHEGHLDAAVFRYLGEVSNGLLLDHPLVWAENSLSDVPRTFDFHFAQTVPGKMNDPVSYTNKPVVASVRGWKILCWITAKEAGVISILYVLTFVAVALALAKTWKARGIQACLIPLTIAAFSLGALACMLAPCILATYDNRYSVPLVPFFAIGAAYVIEQIASARERHRERTVDGK